MIRESVCVVSCLGVMIGDPLLWRTFNSYLHTFAHHHTAINIDSWHRTGKYRALQKQTLNNKNSLLEFTFYFLKCTTVDFRPSLSSCKRNERKQKHFYILNFLLNFPCLILINRSASCRHVFHITISFLAPCSTFNAFISSFCQRKHCSPATYSVHPVSSLH